MQYRNTHPSGFALGVHPQYSCFYTAYNIQTSGITITGMMGMPSPLKDKLNQTINYYNDYNLILI